MLKALKMRFYPTKDQAFQLNLSFGHARWVYNKALETRIKAYELDGASLSGYDIIKLLPEWKQEHEWLKEVSSVILQQKVSDGDRAFKNFFKGLKGKRKVGYPKFKNRYSNDSVRYVGTSFQYKNGEIKLAKQKEPLNIVWSYDKPDNISSVTVSRNKAGQFFISVLTDISIEQLPATDKAIGIDLGIKDFATGSNGAKYSPPNLEKEEKKVVRLQRKLSKKAKGSNNRDKARLRLAKAHQDLKNKKNDYLHKLSTNLVRENQTIVFEDLAVSNMVKNRRLSRAISNQSWYTFTEMVRYKSEWYGRDFIKIDRFFPSSKLCSECGALQDKMPLDIRQWQCACGATHDRDVNAAKNILAAGQAVLVSGENVRPSGVEDEAMAKLNETES